MVLTSSAIQTSLSFNHSFLGNVKRMEIENNVQSLYSAALIGAPQCGQLS